MSETVDAASPAPTPRRPGRPRTNHDARRAEIVDVAARLFAQRGYHATSIGDLAEGDYATVTIDTKVELLQAALADAKVAIVTDREEVRGIVTKIDLIDFLARQPGKGASAPPPPLAAAARKNGDTKGPAKPTKAKKSAKAPKRGKEKARARA